jgi:hypothetical protein
LVVSSLNGSFQTLWHPPGFTLLIEVRELP